MITNIADFLLRHYLNIKISLSIFIYVLHKATYGEKGSSEVVNAFHQKEISESKSILTIFFIFGKTRSVLFDLVP